MSVNQINVNAVNERTKNQAAVELGRLGGKSTSEAKKAAARINGTKRKKKHEINNSITST